MALLNVPKSQQRKRWLVLLLCSTQLFCSYYCYDNPAALYKPLCTTFSEVSSFDYYYSMLYSVYSIPNLVLPVLISSGMVVKEAWIKVAGPGAAQYPEASFFHLRPIWALFPLPNGA